MLPSQGEPIVVAAVGGSISVGRGAANQAGIDTDWPSYLDQFTQWLQAAFPASKPRLVNAAQVGPVRSRGLAVWPVGHEVSGSMCSTCVVGGASRLDGLDAPRRWADLPALLRLQPCPTPCPAPCTMPCHAIVAHKTLWSA